MLSDVTQVIDEVRLLNNRLIALVDELHRGSGITAPQRAVLEFVHRHGPSTVPSIARRRGVTRQHIQTIVNELRSNGLLEARPNPAHRRSPVFALTDEGSRVIARLLERERDHLATRIRGLDEVHLQITARTLADLRHALREDSR